MSTSDLDAAHGAMHAGEVTQISDTSLSSAELTRRALMFANGNKGIVEVIKSKLNKAKGGECRAFYNGIVIPGNAEWESDQDPSGVGRPWVVDRRGRQWFTINGTDAAICASRSRS